MSAGGPWKGFLILGWAKSTFQNCRTWAEPSVYVPRRGPPWYQWPFSIAGYCSGREAGFLPQPPLLPLQTTAKTFVLFLSYIVLHQQDYKLKSSMETSRAHSTTPITQTPIFLLTCVLIQLRMLVNWLFFIILILLQALLEHKEVLSTGKQLRTHEYQ